MSNKNLGIYTALALASIDRHHPLHTMPVIPYSPDKAGSKPTLHECLDSFRKQLSESNDKMQLIHGTKAIFFSFHDLMPNGECIIVIGKNQKTARKILCKILAQNGLRIQEVKPEVKNKPVEPEKSVHGELKGMYGGLCNRTSCQSPSNVIYYNYATRKFYCPQCALLINMNNRADALEIYGHDLCIPMNKEEAAKAYTY
jgi:hypothetical protein